MKRILLLLLYVFLLIPATSIAQNFEETRRAAESGDLIAQLKLGNTYYFGEGVAQDYAEAMKWFRKAAEQGDVFAQNSLGHMYLNGQGVPKDRDEAVTLFRKAAEQGYAEAQYNLGTMYNQGKYQGKGVPLDKNEAVMWYRKAAYQGHVRSQFLLGFAYAYGMGTSVNYFKAYVWLSRGAATGDEMAATHRDKIAYRLSPDALAAAQQLAVKSLDEISMRDGVQWTNSEKVAVVNEDYDNSTDWIVSFIAIQLVFLLLPAIIFRFIIIRRAVKRWGAIIYVVVMFLVWFAIQSVAGVEAPSLRLLSVLWLWGAYVLLQYEKQRIW